MKQIGRYQIREVLGLGRMAQVYRAYDPQLKCEVAIKVLAVHFLGNEQFYLRFKQEAALIASFKHSAVVPLYDFDEVDDQPYLVMQLMSGGSLADRLKAKGKGFSLSDVSELITALADPLDMAHQKGIIHRDLKPSNILFDQQGEAYLSDFGLGKLLEYTNVGLNRSDAPLGTLAYISPEEARGDRAMIDGRSDLYSLGVMLFELLTGQLPFEANVPATFIYKHISASIPNICEIRGDLPQSCQTLIERAMAKKPAERYATAGEMASVLKKVLAENSSAPHRLQRLLQSKRLSHTLWLLFVLGGLGFIATKMPPMPSLTDILANEESPFATPIVITPSVTAQMQVPLTPTLISTKSPTKTIPLANPEEAAIYLEEGEEFYQKREYNQAINKFTEAIRIAPNEAIGYYLRAMAYFSQGEHEQAVADYSQALILDSTLEEAYYYRGQAYEEQGSFALAISDYEAAINFNPSNTHAYLSLADAYLFSARYEEAKTSYDEALRLNPNYDVIYLHRAQSYEQIGNLEAAIADYKKVLQLNHDREVIASAQTALQRLGVE